MKRKYALHPQEYAVEKTEQFYTKMAAKGWNLEKRGAYFSSFIPMEPAKRDYRLIAAIPAASGETPFSEEQIAAYRKNGWEYVTWHGFLHVFGAPGNAGASELCPEPEQQAAALKGLKKRYISSLIQIPLSAAFFLFLGSMLGSYGEHGRLAASIYRIWVENTAGMAGVILLLLWLMFRDVRGAWHLGRLCRRMRDGERAGHESQSGYTIMRYISNFLFLAAVVFGCLAIGQRAGGYDRMMPGEADGPYLVLSDIGVTGERTQSFIKDRVSNVSYRRSLLAEHWDAYEVIDVDGREVWMQQDVYRLKDADMCSALVETLMKGAVFARSPEAFAAADIPGLDRAWVSDRLECVAVKDDYVCFLMYPADRPEELIPILRAVAGKWDSGPQNTR